MIDHLFFSSEFLYVDDVTHINTHGPTSRQQDCQYEKFSAVDQTVKHNLRRFVLDDESLMRNISEKEGESLLAGSLAKALCYHHRYVKYSHTYFTLHSFRFDFLPHKFHASRKGPSIYHVPFFRTASG